MALDRVWYHCSLLRVLLARRGRKLPEMGVPSPRGRNEFHFHLFGQHGPVRMAGSSHRSVYVSLHLYRETRSRDAGLDRALAHVVHVLLVVQAEDFFQGVDECLGVR